MKKQDLTRINILQSHYEQAIANNKNKPDSFCNGITLGLKLALQHFGYDHFQLDDMEFVYNELIRLKK